MGTQYRQARAGAASAWGAVSFPAAGPASGRIAFSYIKALSSLGGLAYAGADSSRARLAPALSGLARVRGAAAGGSGAAIADPTVPHAQPPPPSRFLCLLRLVSPVAIPRARPQRAAVAAGAAALAGTGCSSLLNEGTAAGAGVAGAAIAGAVTDNAAVATGIGLGVQAGAKRRCSTASAVHAAAQDRIAQAAGALAVGAVASGHRPRGAAGGGRARPRDGQPPDRRQATELQGNRVLGRSAGARRCRIVAGVVARGGGAGAAAPSMSPPSAATATSGNGPRRSRPRRAGATCNECGAGAQAPRRVLLRILAAGALLSSLGGCSSFGDISGAVAGVATGALTANPALGAGWRSVSAAADAAGKAFFRHWHEAEQDSIAAVIGTLEPDRPGAGRSATPALWQRAWLAARHPCHRHAAGALQGSPVFGRRRRRAARAQFLTTACEQGGRWKWLPAGGAALGQPAVAGHESTSPLLVYFHDSAV